MMMTDTINAFRKRTLKIYDPRVGRVAGTVRLRGVIDLTLESLSTFVTSPADFKAAQPGSLNRALADWAVAHLEVTPRLRALLEIYQDQVSKEVVPRADRSQTPYRAALAAAGSAPFGPAMKALAAQKIIDPRLKSDASGDLVPYRSLQARIVRIICRETEEQLVSSSPGDEIYCIAHGSVYADGKVLFSRSRLSPVETGVMKSEELTLSEDFRCILSAQLQKPKEGALLPPVMALIDTVICEREYSDEEQRMAALSAMESLATGLAALVSAGWGGVVAALLGILRSLMVVLDRDDVLGAATYLVPSWLEGAPIATSVEEKVTDPDGSYEYDVKYFISTQDGVGPRPVLEFSGPANLRAKAQRTSAYYHVRADTILDKIAWKVAAADDGHAVVSTLENGGMTARITFNTWDSYDVTVEATNMADERPLSGHYHVRFEQDHSGPGGITP